MYIPYLKKYFCIDIIDDFKALCMYYLYLCVIDFILSLQVLKKSRTSCVCHQAIPQH